MKPVFLRELKAYRKGLLFWCIGMFAMLGASMAKFAGLQSTGQSVSQLFTQFPKTVQVIFGISGFDLTKASDYYGMLFLYIVLMVTVHAVLLGTGIICKEERDRTSEFLFVKPISRAKAISAKLLAGVVNLIVLNLVTLVSSIWMVNYFSKTSPVTHTIEVLMLGAFILQLIFFFASTAIAAVSKKPKAAPSIATGVLLGTFILYYFVNIDTSFDGLKYLTPFKYFEAKPVMNSGQLGLQYVVISAILIVGSIYLTYTAFTKRDLDV